MTDFVIKAMLSHKVKLGTVAVPKGLAQQVRKKALSEKITLKKLSERLGVEYSTFLDVINGQRGRTSHTVIQKLKGFLDG